MKKPAKERQNPKKTSRGNLGQRLAALPLGVIMTRKGFPNGKKKGVNAAPVTNKTDNDPYKCHFIKTKKHLESLREFCRCVICGAYPEKVFSTSCCEHKYCEKCIVPVKGKLCSICDTKVRSDQVKLDKFCNGLIAEIEKFRKALWLLVNQH